MAWVQINRNSGTASLRGKAFGPVPKHTDVKQIHKTKLLEPCSATSLHSHYVNFLKSRTNVISYCPTRSHHPSISCQCVDSLCTRFVADMLPCFLISRKTPRKRNKGKPPSLMPQKIFSLSSFPTEREGFLYPGYDRFQKMIVRGHCNLR